MTLGAQKIFKHPLFKGGIIYALTDAINKAVPFLILPLLTHYLTPSDYGIVANYTVYTSILLIFIGLNLNGAIAVNFFKMNKAKVAEYMFNLFVILVISVVVCFIVIAVSGKLFQSFLPIGYGYLLLGILITFAQMITLFNMELWRLEEKPVKFGIYQISQTLLNFLLTMLFVIALKENWEGRIWAIALATMAYGLFSLGFIIKRGYLKIAYNKEFIRDALRFGVPLLPHALSIWLRTGIDRIFLTHFYGTEATGLYSIGFQFGLLISFLNMAFNNAYVPYLYKNLGRPDVDTLKGKLVKFTYLNVLIQIGFALFFSVASYIIIDHFLPASYQRSKEFISWAMISQAFNGMYLMVVPFYFYAKKTKFLATITFSAAALQMLTSYFLIKYYGPIGAAYSTAIMSFFTLAAVWLFVNKVYQMPWMVSFLSKKK
jgi:O-antigen/teichoic acid export membrane protein